MSAYGLRRDPVNEPVNSVARPPARIRPVVLTPPHLEVQATPRASKAVRVLYRPSRVRGLAGREAGIAVLRRPAGGHGDGFPFDVRALLAACGLRYDDVATIGSRRHRVWVMGLVRSGTVATIVKVHHTDHSTLHREAGWLAELSRCTEGFRVPGVVGLDVVDDWVVLAMEAVPGRPLLARPDLDVAIDVCAGLARARDGAGVTHGDLAPCNLLGRRRPWLIDWERAGDFVLGADLAHYVLVSIGLRRAMNPRAVRVLLSSGSWLVRRFAHRVERPVAEVEEGVDAYIRSVRAHRSVAGQAARSTFGDGSA